MKYLIGKTGRLRHKCYDNIKEEIREIHRRMFDSKPKSIIKSFTCCGFSVFLSHILLVLEVGRISR